MDKIIDFPKKKNLRPELKSFEWHNYSGYVTPLKFKDIDGDTHFYIYDNRREIYASGIIGDDSLYVKYINFEGDDSLVAIKDLKEFYKLYKKSKQ